MVVTNGDNEYDTDFMPRLNTVPLAVGLVAFDFFSRFQRPTGVCVLGGPAPAANRWEAVACVWGGGGW